MKGRLDLKNMIIRLKLGSENHEKISSRDVPVSLVWTGEIAGSLSVDYSEVCDVLAEFEGKEYDYIEELAFDIRDVLRKAFPEGSWKVTVTKPFPQVRLKLESASFTVEGSYNG